MKDKPFYPSIYTEEAQSLLQRVIEQVERMIIGKREGIEHILICLLAGGHILLEDRPGVGKTMLARAFAKSLDCEMKRISFTPDLMPSDITGVSIYNRKTGEFEFRHGPLMANLILADELNRTAPGTQSALLEAMEEGSITNDGDCYLLPQPFMVIATQNPLDYEGTYLLPEAQLDRFMMRISLGYPDLSQEVEMLGRLKREKPLERIKPQLMREELVAIHEYVRTVHVDDPVCEYIVHLARATREQADCRSGVSPRASYALLRASQAHAVLRGRSYVIPDDVKSMLVPVFAHRLLIKPEAGMRGLTGEQIIGQLVNQVAVPALRQVSGH